MEPFWPLIASGVLFLICLISAVAVGKGLQFFGVSILWLVGICVLFFMWACTFPESLTATLEWLPFLSGVASSPYGMLVVAFFVVQALPGVASILGWLSTVPFHEPDLVTNTSNPYGELA